MSVKRHITITRGALYGLLIAYVCLFAVAFISIQYANYAVRTSNQKWCSMITSLDDTYREQPPATNLGRKLARDFNELRREFEC